MIAGIGGDNTAGGAEIEDALSGRGRSDAVCAGLLPSRFPVLRTGKQDFKKFRLSL
jgi:hypothetical protein